MLLMNFFVLMLGKIYIVNLMVGKISIFDDFITQKWSNWIEIFDKLLGSILRHVFNSVTGFVAIPTIILFPGLYSDFK